MPITFGMRLTGAMHARPIDEIAAFAREAGLGALDLPADFREGAAACARLGLRVGTVDVARQGQLLSADDAVRAAAVSAFEEHIRELPGDRVLFLVLIPEDDQQPIARSLAIFKETFPAVARACEAA